MSAANDVSAPVCEAERRQIGETAISFVTASGDAIDAASRRIAVVLLRGGQVMSAHAVTIALRAVWAAGIAEGRAQARRQHAEDLLEQARSFER